MITSEPGFKVQSSPHPAAAAPARRPAGLSSSPIRPGSLPPGNAMDTRYERTASGAPSASLGQKHSRVHLPETPMAFKIRY